jgi:hypothetical protein
MQKKSTKRKQPKGSTKHGPTRREKALLLEAAKVLGELRAGPHPDGELSPGEEWLQEEQDKFDAQHPNTPEELAKFRRALKKLR